jgi:hypothetical protein
MTPLWQDVRCASIPAADLAVLADLRRESAIRVMIAGDRAWVSWDDGPGFDLTRRIVLGRLLPLPGVEVFVRRGGRWHRPGESLPAFHVPIGDGPAGLALDRLILPEPLAVSRPGGEPPAPVPLHLVRDDSECHRPAVAVRGRLTALASWAERAPSSWIESLSAAWAGPVGGNPEEAEVLILGVGDRPARAKARAPAWDPATRRGPPVGGRMRLPAIEGGLRFWGGEVLIPLGYRAEPELADDALRQAVGAGPDDLLILDHDGAELIPREAFRRLSRASIRLAASGQPDPGGPIQAK